MFHLGYFETFSKTMFQDTNLIHVDLLHQLFTDKAT